MDPLTAALSFWMRGTPLTPKLRASCQLNVYVARAKIFGLPGTFVQFSIDGGFTQTRPIRPNGKANAKWLGVPSGSHTAHATTDTLGYTLYRNYSCR